MTPDLDSTVRAVNAARRPALLRVVRLHVSDNCTYVHHRKRAPTSACYVARSETHVPPLLAAPPVHKSRLAAQTATRCTSTMETRT